MVKKKETFEEDKTESGLSMDDLNVELDLEAKPAVTPKTSSGESEDVMDEAVAMSDDVPVRLVAVLGRKKIVLKDLLRLKVGQAIDFERPPNEFVDLVANGKLVARGELVEIDGKLGVRIIKMLK
ncbi:MAG: FliM/FliN family flagellar motor switch protein [Deltaproteobacteria bacterium]|nr:FliM/FliN family flagellar motor switch protein [Deltaproteobacteria bacterium]